MTLKKNHPNKATATTEAVAAWMLKELDKQDGVLCQDDAAAQIADRFGGDFVYENDRGNVAIDKQVLAAFRRLTGDSVVWIRGERLWRRRESGDEATRLQD